MLLRLLPFSLLLLPFVFNVVVVTVTVIVVVVFVVVVVLVAIVVFFMSLPLSLLHVSRYLGFETRVAREHEDPRGRMHNKDAANDIPSDTFRQCLPVSGDRCRLHMTHA